MKRISLTTVLVLSVFLASAQRTIDYRYCQSPVRDQGDRGTCTAFAIAAILETFDGVPANLSEQYLYACMQMGDYLDTAKAITPGGSVIGYRESLYKFGVLHESRLPYNKTQLQVADTDQRLVKVIREAQLGPVSVFLQKDFAKTYVHPDDCKTYIFFTAQDTATIKQLLRDGHKGIAVGYYVNAEWSKWMKKKNLLITPDSVGFFMKDSAISVTSFHDLKQLYGDQVWDHVNSYYSLLQYKPYSFQSFLPPEGHALTIVGYNDDGFIIKNSWGTGWGNNGYCVMSYDYHMLFASQALVVNKVTFSAPSPVTGLAPVTSDIRLKVIPGKASEGISLSLFCLDKKYDPVFSSVEYKLYEVTGTQKKLLDTRLVIAPLTGYHAGFPAKLMEKKLLPLSLVTGKTYMQVEMTARHAITNTLIRRVYKKIGVRNDEYIAAK